MADRLALADLKHAEGLVDAELAALDKAKKAADVNGPLFRMTEILLTPPQQREDLLRSRIGAGWRPGFSH